MRFLTIALAFFALFLAYASCNDEFKDRYSHAEFVYPAGKYNMVNEELRTFLEKELKNYKKIVISEADDIQQPQLHFIDKNSGEATETVFPNYFPVSLLKEMLKNNGFLIVKEDF